MSKKNEQVSRRGILKGEWFKKIRAIGAKKVAEETETEVHIKKPEGQEPQR